MKVINKHPPQSLNEIFQKSGMQFSFLSRDGTAQATVGVKCRDFLSDAMFVNAGLFTESRIYGFEYTGIPPLDPTGIIVENFIELKSMQKADAVFSFLFEEYKKSVPIKLGDKEARLFRFPAYATSSTFGVGLATHLIRCCAFDSEPTVDAVLEGSKVSTATDGSYSTSIIKKGGSEWVAKVFAASDSLWKIQSAKGQNINISQIHNNGGIFSLAEGSTPWKECNDYAWK